jgi:hypothetical protein
MDILNNFISFGPHCCPRQRLDYIKNKYGMCITETHFFDYLMVNINTIKNIFNIENIETYINYQNINIYGSGNEHLHIELKNIELKSIHDVDKNLDNSNTESTINEQFIEKYIRRYNRLIDFININEKICFIYQSIISYEDYTELNNIFNEKFMNKEIIIISFYDFGENKPILEKFGNLYYLNYNSMYITKDYIYDSFMCFLNWDLIFEHMKNIYNNHTT